MFAGRSVYKIDGVEQMQTDIMKNGPITGTFMMYTDFLGYKSGNTVNVLFCYFDSIRHRVTADVVNYNCLRHQRRVC